MGETTGIAWTHHTFNPWFGCTKVSPGCDHCYAQTFDKRIGGDHWGSTAARRFFGDKHWNEPRRWNRAAEKAGHRARVFCASMADVFEDRQDLNAQRFRLFDLIEETPALDWQLLTKRPQNMTRLAPESWAKAWPSNVWAGCTAEDQERADERIPHLLRVPAAVRFVSYEPAIGPVDFSFSYCAACNVTYYDAGERNDCPACGEWAAVRCGRRGVDWIIVGGESGGKSRPFDVAWAQAVIAQCEDAGVAVFVKQLGSLAFGEDYGAISEFDVGCRRRLALRDRKGGDMAEWPEDLREREFPEARG